MPLKTCLMSETRWDKNFCLCVCVKPQHEGGGSVCVCVCVCGVCVCVCVWCVCVCVWCGEECWHCCKCACWASWKVACYVPSQQPQISVVYFRDVSVSQLLNCLSFPVNHVSVAVHCCLLHNTTNTGQFISQSFHCIQ